MTKIFYFSGTGNSYAIAEGLARELGDAELIPIGWEPAPPVPEDCRVGIVAPVYFLDLPPIVRSFMKTLRLSGGTRAFAVVNMGLHKGSALSHARRFFLKRGAETFSGYSIQMPDNSIVFPTKEEEIPGFLSASREAVTRIAGDLKRSGAGDPVRWKPLSDLAGGAMKAYCERVLGFRDIRADGKCSGCGVCARVCPVKNIGMSGGLPVWGDRCASCFACIHRCPQNAVGFRKMDRRAFKPYAYPRGR